MRWSDGWSPGEDVLLDGFVAGVEGGLQEEERGDAVGKAADIWQEVDSKPGPLQNKGSGTRQGFAIIRRCLGRGRAHRGR